MDKTCPNNVESASQSVPKDYTAPTLTQYGDIASLVKMVVVNGADGGMPPFEAVS